MVLIKSAFFSFLQNRKYLNAGTHFVFIPLDCLPSGNSFPYFTELNRLSECTGLRPLKHLYILLQLVGHFITDLIQV